MRDLIVHVETKKLYLIYRLKFGAVHFLMAKMLVFANTIDMYKSFGT